MKILVALPKVNPSLEKLESSDNILNGTVGCSGTESLGERVIDGLSNMKAVAKNGVKAGVFVRQKFSPDFICNSWINLLNKQTTEPSLPTTWENPSDLVRDLMRWSGTGMLINRYRSADSRKLLTNAGK